jgi:hypothetical protein
MPSDRAYDLSLRILMTVVLVVLAGCVYLLAQRWAKPVEPPNAVVPLTQADPAPVRAPVPNDAQASAQVLLSPGQIFRCDAGGRVTFSDRPCPERR